MKYNKLRQTHGDLAAADSDDNNGAFRFSLPTVDWFSSVHLPFVHLQFDVFQMGFSDEGLPALRILDHLTLLSSNNGGLMSELPLQTFVTIIGRRFQKCSTTNSKSLWGETLWSRPRTTQSTFCYNINHINYLKHWRYEMSHRCTAEIDRKSVV